MTPHWNPAGPAETGWQLARPDAVLSSTGENHHLGCGFGVAVKSALLTERVSPPDVERAARALPPGLGGAS
jgi:hypothetical protein